MSKLKKIINEELGQILTKEGLYDRAMALKGALSSEPCQGANRDICKAQSLIKGFLSKVVPLERELQKDISKLKLPQATGLEELFKRHGQVQNVLDHLDSIAEADPNLVAGGQVPGLLDGEFAKAKQAMDISIEAQSRMQAQKDSLDEVLDSFTALLALQKNVKDLFDTLFQMNEELSNNIESLEIDDDFVENSIDGLLQARADLLDEIEDMEEEYTEAVEEVSAAVLTVKQSK